MKRELERFVVEVNETSDSEKRETLLDKFEHWHNREIYEFERGYTGDGGPSIPATKSELAAAKRLKKEMEDVLKALNRWDRLAKYASGPLEEIGCYIRSGMNDKAVKLLENYMNKDPNYKKSYWLRDSDESWLGLK